MTHEEALKIFKSWQEFQEINDKLMNFFRFSGIPESFLPYHIKDLEEALNIIAKDYFDSGDHKASETIQATIAFLLSYKSDEEAYENITTNTILKDSKIKSSLLKNLKTSKESWDQRKKD